MPMVGEPSAGRSGRHVGQLKSGVNAVRVPLYDLVSNRVFMVIATLA